MSVAMESEGLDPHISTSKKIILQKKRVFLTMKTTCSVGNTGVKLEKLN